MFRGFRWQILALIIAAAVFIISFVLSSGDDPTNTPAPASTATEVSIAPPTNEVAFVPETQISQPNTGTDLQAAVSSVPTQPAFREALVGHVQRLNPLFSNLNPVDRDITALMFEGLVGINQFGEPVPVLARNWIIAPNNLEYVVELREDVAWHDGVAFSADDVMYTMSILRSQDFPGSADLNTFWKTVETEQLGEHLVRFRLTQPMAGFLDALRIGLLPAHALEGTNAAQLATHPFNLSPIGTGPYQLEALRSNDSDRIETVELRVAPNYRQRPEGQSNFALEYVHFRLYESFDAALRALQVGEADGLAARNRSERTVLRQINGTLHSALEPTVGVLIFNWVDDEIPYFREQRVREALETGLNRQSIIERRLSNLAVAANSPLLPGSWAFIELPPSRYDPELARQLLETANIQLPEDDDIESTEGSEGQGSDVIIAPTNSLLTFSILTPNDDQLQAVVAEIQAQWALYGVDVQLDVQDATIYQERLSEADFDAALVELTLSGSADPDVYGFWDQGQYPDGKNYGGVNDRGISELLERARRDPNGLNRAVHYAEFQRQFAERTIAIPLYYPLFTYITAPHIDNIQLPRLITSPADRFLTLREWTFVSN